MWQVVVTVFEWLVLIGNVICIYVMAIEPIRSGIAAKLRARKYRKSSFPRRYLSGTRVANALQAV
jgi:hypothetical protein